MDYQQVNDYLTSIFNNVLVIEEVSLRGSRFKDISIKEMHTIDVIGKYPEVTPSQVSKEFDGNTRDCDNELKTIWSEKDTSNGFVQIRIVV